MLDLLELLKLCVSDKMFRKNHCKPNTFVRERLLPLRVVVSMILKLAKKNLALEQELYFIDDPKSASKQAFSKARYNILHTGFLELLKITVKQTLITKKGLCKGYRLIACDGSTLRLPEGRDIIERFGRFSVNGTTGKMPCLARASVFVDLCTGLVIDGEMGRWDEGEQTLAQRQLPKVVKALEGEKALFIYDRGYPSYQFACQHLELGCDFLFRLQRGMYKKIWARVEAGETDFNAEIFQKGKSKKTITVRVVAIRLESGEIEVLITSVPQEALTKENLARIYALRWQIEECYKKVKFTMQLENFSGKTCEAVLQDFYAHLVMMNILTHYMLDHQQPWNIDTIPEYRLNFTLIFGVMREHLQRSLVGRQDTTQFRIALEKLLPRCKVRVKTGRNFDRSKVNKPKRHHVFRRAC